MKTIWKVSVAIWEQIFVHTALAAGVTGLNVSSDFTILLTKDGASQTVGGGGIAVTIAEIANGRYSITWTPPSAGQWELVVIQASNGIVATYSYNVTADGADFAGILARLPAALVSGRMDSHVGAMANNVVTDAAIASDVDTYQAKIWLIDDDAGVKDRWVVKWFKNSQPLAAGVTVPTIQVVNLLDGSNLIAPSAMTDAGSARFKFDEASARVVSGQRYMAVASATIDGSTRTWEQPIGRDSA